MAHNDTLVTAFHELVEHRRKTGRNAYPTVLGVGAGRCGTTTLYNIFLQTPGIYVPPVKELNFFGRAPLSKDIYAMYFGMGATEMHRCEISPYYLTQKGVAQQIYSTLGCVKIIIQIRNPIDRFISHYRQHAVPPRDRPLDTHGISDFGLYVDIALRSYGPEVHASTGWYLPAKALSQSLYYDAVNTYRKIFGAANVLIIDYPELKNPERLCRALSGFLGLSVDPSLVALSNDSVFSPPSPSSADIARLKDFFKDDYQRVHVEFNSRYESLAA